ncbi:MAG: lipocalin family protein [Fluviicoccus sp.]|uniref:lipocalin family protein n=1 Tax=Fluviicoccus sp. TaxID=2003552 RepID=UPI00271C2EF2|nr:lipocalin family protein [Fluviicoccus sp.]MDO8330297.1 lipocalin family protein [Fluviicoccus sp.]
MNTRRWMPLLMLLASVTAKAEPVTTVPRVDLARYLGTWYEIAHLPMFFQHHCIGDTTAQYGLREDGRITVLNRCRTDNGWQEATGRAKVVPDTVNARLKVTFFWPFSGNYWVIGLDPEYRWALVGNPSRKYLWLLSRTPQLSPDLFEEAQKAAIAQGYELSGLLMTPHLNGSSLRHR